MIDRVAFDELADEGEYLYHEGIYTAQSGETTEVVHREYADSSRWDEVWLLVLKDSDGRLWGVYYNVAATEMQDHTPPEYSYLFEVEEKEITTTVYLPVKK